MTDEATTPIRVGLVDDQQLLREGLATMLGRSDEFEVVGHARHGLDALDLVRRTRPDVVLMDIRMPRMDGIAATRAITSDRSLAAVRVLMLTTFDDDELVRESIRAGASGFILKDISPDGLREAVRVVSSGDALLSPAVTRPILEQVAVATPRGTRAGELATITGREREVLALIGRGLSNDEIAGRLFISSATVRTYVSRILTKTVSRDRAQLVVLAYESGLVVPGQDD